MANPSLQNKTVAAAGSALSVTTPSITTVTGDLIVVASGSFNASLLVPSDSAGRTYSSALSEISAPGRSRIRINYTSNITGGSGQTFTCTVATTDFPTITVQEFTDSDGVFSPTPLDQVLGNNPPGASGVFDTGAAPVTTQANEVVTGHGVDGGGFAGPLVNTDGAPWVQDSEQDLTATLDGCISAHKFVTATGAFNYRYTHDAETGAEVVAIATWKTPASIVQRRNLPLLGVGS